MRLTSFPRPWIPVSPRCVLKRRLFRRRTGLAPSLTITDRKRVFLCGHSVPSVQLHVCLSASTTHFIPALCRAFDLDHLTSISVLFS